jgi:hypothetical protein
MESATIGLIASLAISYAAVGSAVAAAFLTRGVGKVMPGAHASYAFRVLLIPGAVLLWPLVLQRWAALRRTPAHGAP